MATLDYVTGAYEKLKTAKATIEKRQRQELAEQLDLKRQEFGLLVYKAKQEGASIAELGRQMGTTARNTVYQFIEVGRQAKIAEDSLLEGVADRRSVDYSSEEGSFGKFWTVPKLNGEPAEIIWDDLENQWNDHLTGEPAVDIDIKKFESYLEEKEYEKS